ncbi:MAG: ABC transporter [Nitrospirae bacterium GWC2_56_14]|nr:MAG: ABC transporter [Nitrospirae bacterium GWC2_56_14]
MPQIIVENITKTYLVDTAPIDAVRSVSMRIEKGDFISIVGHSGSGKTTLLSMIGGITRPSSGKILFEGEDIYELASDRVSEYRCEKIGFMFQFASLLPILTVKENLLLPTVFRPRPAGREAAKAEELLHLVGLTEKINVYPAQLSGGQQRRVAIARAFMNDPALVLADEPTGDLDEETEGDMMRFFKTMNESKGVTFIMVTHNTDLAKQTKQHLRMNQGTLQTV